MYKMMYTDNYVNMRQLTHATHVFKITGYLSILPCKEKKIKLYFHNKISFHNIYLFYYLIFQNSFKLRSNTLFFVEKTQI